MPKNLNTNIWTIDGSGYTQTVADLFTSTPPVYTHADHIDNSFNLAVCDVNEQKKRAVLHMTDRASNTYNVENTDNLFIGNWIYDNRGNYTNQINTVVGNGTGGVSNFKIAPNSGNQPAANFKIICNYDYKAALWSPRINIAPINSTTGVIGTYTSYSLNDLDGVSTAGDAEAGETWWEYYKRKETDYILTMDQYSAHTYTAAGCFISNSICEWQTRAGIPAAYVAWKNAAYSYRNIYTDGCYAYYSNGREYYADMQFDVIFSYSADIMVKKAEWDDTHDNVSRHNIRYGIKIDKDTILKIICSYGLPFSFRNAINISIGNEDYALPEVKNNIITGKYFRGNDAVTADTDNNRWGNTQYIDNKPAGGGGGGGGDDDSTDPTAVTGAPYATGLAHYYISTAGSAALSQISEAMSTWDIDATKKDLYKNLISCKIIKPPTAIPSENSTFEIYGVKPQYQGADITIPIVKGNPDISFGPYTIDRKFNDFRDFAPYTKVEIYLPYCGWCALPSHVVGRSVSVHYFTDVIAATCKAVVFCGSNIVAEAAGVIGLDVPFASENVGAKMAAATSGLLSYGQGALQASAGIGQMAATRSSQGLKNAAGGLSQVLSAYTQLAMTANENWTEICGKSGDGCCLSGATDIHIKVTRPKKGDYTDPPYVPPGFAHSVGFVSNKQVTVSSITGLLIADNVDTSGISEATDAERAEIKRVLETGLIVNAAPEE